MRDWCLSSKSSPGWGHCCGPWRLGFSKPNQRSKGSWVSSRNRTERAYPWGGSVLIKDVNESSPPVLEACEVHLWGQAGNLLDLPLAALETGHICCQIPFATFNAVLPFYFLNAPTSLHWEVSVGRISDKTSQKSLWIQSIFSLQ